MNTRESVRKKAAPSGFESPSTASVQQIADLLKLMNDRTRMQILVILTEGPKSARQISKHRAKASRNSGPI